MDDLTVFALAPFYFYQRAREAPDNQLRRHGDQLQARRVMMRSAEIASLVD